MKIQITVYGDNLLPPYPDVEDMDIEASQHHYVEMLEERIQAAYPDAEVSIDLVHNIEGPPPAYFVDTEDYQEHEQIAARIDWIKEDLGDKWIVGRRSP